MKTYIVMYVKADGTATGNIAPMDPKLPLGDQVSYEKLSEFIGGPLEYVEFDEHSCGYCHEEGKLLGLPINAMATELFNAAFGVGHDVIVGPFVYISVRERASI